VSSHSSTHCDESRPIRPLRINPTDQGRRVPFLATTRLAGGTRPKMRPDTRRRNQMLAHRCAFLFLLAGVALVVACGGGNTASGASTTSTTSAEVIAVAGKIWAGPGGNPCNSATISGCPVTPRLAARITQIEAPSAIGSGPPNSWCRCQNVADVAMTADITPSGGTAHVDFKNGVKVDFIMVEQAGSLLVDDTQCTGRGASTSIYVDPPALCG